MSLYLFHEGLLTEKLVYRAWIRHALPGFREVEAAPEVGRDTFFLFAGGGFPEYVHPPRRPDVDILRVVRANLFLCVVFAASCTGDPQQPPITPDASSADVPSSPDVPRDVATELASDASVDVPPDASSVDVPRDVTVDAPAACGAAAPRTGQWYETIMSGGVSRRFYVSVPANYDPARRYPVVFGLHGRDYDGIRMRTYLALEDQRPNDWALFVYPDALQRDWGGGFTAIGWQNGPVATQTSRFGGTDDLRFIDDVVAWVRARYCVDDARFFATGQSWGGDFSNVVGCFRGTTFRAVAPVAANGDYYLPTRPDAAAPCVGSPAVWAFHGIADPSFALSLGERYRDFWLRAAGCDTSMATPLTLAGEMSDDTCVEYGGCNPRVRWCAYNAASGHQIPRAYYPREVVAFFRGF